MVHVFCDSGVILFDAFEEKITIRFEVNEFYSKFVEARVSLPTHVHDVSRLVYGD